MPADTEVIIVIDGYDRGDEGLYTLHINACREDTGDDDDDADGDWGGGGGGGGGWGD